MNEQNTQEDYGGMSHDQILAALSFATHQGEQHLPQQDQMMQSQVPPVEPQDASGSMETPETENTEAIDIRAEIQGVEERLMETIESLREEIKGSSPDKSRQEIESLKKQLSDILNEQDE